MLASARFQLHTERYEKIEFVRNGFFSRYILLH